MSEGKDKVLDELSQVKHLGKTRAEQVYEELDIRSLDELIEAAETGALRNVSGIGEKTEITILNSAKRLRERGQPTVNGHSELAEDAKSQDSEPSPPNEADDSQAHQIDESHAGLAGEVQEVIEEPPLATAPSSDTPLLEPEDRSASDEVVEAKKPKEQRAKESQALEEVEIEEETSAPGHAPRREGEAEPKAQAADPTPVRQAPSPSAQDRDKLAASKATVTTPNEGPSTVRQAFFESLVCPNCGNETFEHDHKTLTCKACRREYNIEDTVVDLAPPQLSNKNLAQRLMQTQFYARYYERTIRPRVTQSLSERTPREEYMLAADLLQLEADCRLLDVACGPANFTRYFASRIREMPRVEDHEPLIVATDLAWAMLKEAKQSTQRDGLADTIHLVRGDATRLPFQRRRFNRLHCAGALNFIDNVNEVFRNFARVLDRDGICVVGTYTVGRGLLGKALKRAVEFPSNMHWFTPEEIRLMLERAGFEVLEEHLAGGVLTVQARRD